MLSVSGLPGCRFPPCLSWSFQSLPQEYSTIPPCAFHCTNPLPQDKFTAEPGLSPFANHWFSAAQPCSSMQWWPSEGRLDHKFHLLPVHSVDVVAENKNPWLLKQETEMGSMCRYSARELDPDYICFSIISNTYQLSGGKISWKKKALHSLEETHHH